MAPYNSHIEILKSLCRGLRPNKILEWGPGFSTKNMMDECPWASVLTIEHQLKYYNMAMDEFKGYPNLRVVHIPHDLTPGFAEGYVTYPLRELLPGKTDVYDLILVDGRSRCDCLTLAYLLLDPEGVVFLHDSERPNYHKGFEPFPHVFGRNGHDIGVAMACKSLSRVELIKSCLDSNPTS